MPFDPILAEIRFGTGLSPLTGPPQSVAAMLRALRGTDHVARRVRLPLYSLVRPSLNDQRMASLARNAARGTDGLAAAQAALTALQREVREVQGRNLALTMARWAATGDGLRERLVGFWADHFTVIARNGGMAHMVTPFVEEVIRPRILGKFADLLWQVARHPLMQFYLDQRSSVGPQSQIGSRRDTGLNENYARELLELHTLGVDAPYDQTDVRQLAELLTGLTLRQDRSVFDPRLAEPGTETVLGETYGPDPSEAAIREVLGDLARHPATARHLARKLAVHFVSDRPPERLVADLADAYLGADGDLGALTGALLEHEDAWVPERVKVRLPFEFIAAGFRALGVGPDWFEALTLADTRRAIETPLRIMGQPFEHPPGPDGWAQEAASWIIPQGMAARINWAMTAPAKVVDALPDPRDFVVAALGPEAPEAVRFAAGAAESVGEGIGLVLASAAFQRR